MIRPYAAGLSALRLGGRSSMCLACATAATLVLTAGLASGQSAADQVPVASSRAPKDPADGAIKIEEAAPTLTAAEQAAKAIAYLRSVQDEKTGGWSIPPQGPTFPAITALVLTGMLMEPGMTAEDPAVKRAVEFILSKQQPDGGIYDQLLPSYNTAISISALAKLPRTPELQERIDRAVAFLKTLQYGEGAQVRDGFAENAAVVDRSHAFYGGWGYGRHGRPDLSNSGWAIEALKDAGVDPSDAAFQRALVFLRRTQMTDAPMNGKAGGEPINDMPYAAGSSQGGFIYATSVNRDTIGSGQSQAGEFVESMSGGPGVIGTVRLGKGPDGKPILLTNNEVERRIQLYLKQSTDPAVHDQAGNFMVVLGPSGDGMSASSFTVHFAITEPEKVRTILWDTLSQELENAAAVQVRLVEQWQGVSHLRAYGSMTYSGFKSLLYAGLKKGDPRVDAALGWIQKNYTVEENPGLGTDGMYYYYVVFARALHALGQPTLEVTSEDGEKSPRNWGHDLAARLSTLQNDDGSFRSVDDRWMENNPVLITAYSLVALQHARGAEGGK
jgi:hypothetical protein